ncbi:hypothetical protein LTR08_007357 [Meristemomyces frigidus]|nr:hypothetical protein LTR08_007357 [Meristemomyces frigidus]
MAPHGHKSFLLSVATWRPMQALFTRETSPDTDSTGQSQAIPIQRSGAESAVHAPAASNSLYLGIGAGVGGALLIAIVLVVIQLVRKRKAHKRAVTELEQPSEPVHAAQGQEIGEVPRPVSIARCGSLLPMHGRAGWGALSSDETLHEYEPTGRKDKRKRNSISLPKRIKQRGIPLKRLKHLSAIIESPRSRGAKSPSPAVPDMVSTPVRSSTAEKLGFRKTITMIHPAERDEDVFTVPGSPKLHVLPCFAIRSPGMYGAAIANEEQQPRSRPPRSVSTGALLGPIPEAAIFGHAVPPSRPHMHSRSLSLGAPASEPPSGPVPPVPVIVPHRTNSDDSNRQGMCVSRLSSSSQESASSSVLVTSPILTFRDKEAKQTGSPSVEQLIADEDGAQLKSVMNRQWQNPLITGPRPMDASPLVQTVEATVLPRNHASIRSNIARYSSDSLDSHRISAALSTISSDSGRNRLSIPQIATADRMSISRVSSYNSLRGAPGSASVQKITTPRKASRKSSVSAGGSPAERRRISTLAPTPALRDIHPNAAPATPSRQASHSTQNSGRSSNGNPFQWDLNHHPSLPPVAKPSALKGSPNARGSKGHKRQNCVRISTLTPQVLGPPPLSRPTSPPVMCGIDEEPGSEEGKVQSNAGVVGFARTTQQQVRVQTFRASLTPSSPTLSTWTAYREQSTSHSNSNLDLGLPSRQNSDSQLSVSPIARSASRLSDRSSAFSIPCFPSPSKATVSQVRYVEQVVPEFSLSRPSTDEEGWDSSSSPFAPHGSSRGGAREEVALPSSPPLPVREDQGYDSASPTGQCGADGELERSSPAYFPFALSGPCSDDGEHVSPHSRPVSYGGSLPDTPPCSPKTMPSDAFNALFESPTTRTSTTIAPAPTTIRPQRSAEKLTSANASAIMATIPENPVTLGFPTGVPILSPPSEQYQQSPSQPMTRRQRATSNLEPLRPAPLSPLHIAKQPLGPRTEPAKSVLRNAMALRRMNSEIDTSERGSRRYTRLAREPSPLLPWIGSGSDGGCSELFDFDFASEDVGPGAEMGDEGVAGVGRGQGEMATGALDELDMTDLDRRLDGALAGFDAGPSVAESRASSVWEDGELFWLREPAKTAKTAELAGDGHRHYYEYEDAGEDSTTPTKKTNALGRERQGRESLLATPVAAGLKMSVLMGREREWRGSGVGLRTPGSLYDEDGFLNT